MKTIVYHKLVRDRIPQIIEENGQRCETEILSPAQYLKMLDAKLDEELAEYHQDPSAEELADLLEVIYAAAAARGYPPDVLDRVRTEKANRRGRFEKRIQLNRVIVPDEEQR